ncbi:MAG TPA: phosphatase PAP2 family protein [Stenotrophomonas sp.]|nr:phosphatase PAP2 family protein [Stenotrophomonas sp.]
MLLLAACAATGPAHGPVPELKPGVPAGYLGRDLPDSLALLPPPPAAGSAAFANDQAMHAAAQRFVGTPRYAQAARDADLAFPVASNNFACALGVPINAQATPRLYLLMQRTMVDAGLATYAAKEHYQRTRPFVVHDEHTCLPRDEQALRSDGSYPSGHTSIGWTWALVLTQVAPQRANALLARGRNFGESRLVCNAHWQSDVLQGRAVAAGAFARLQSNPDFLSDVAAARREVEAQRSAGATPSDCDAEAAALTVPLPGVM